MVKCIVGNYYHSTKPKVIDYMEVETGAYNKMERLPTQVKCHKTGVKNILNRSSQKIDDLRTRRTLIHWIIPSGIVLTKTSIIKKFKRKMIWKERS